MRQVFKREGVEGKGGLGERGMGWERRGKGRCGKDDLSEGRR